MHLAFFDFVTHYGGSQRSTVELAARLSARADVTILDPYGCCEDYTGAIRDAGLRHVVLCAGSKRTDIGFAGQGWRRWTAMAASLPGLWRVRRSLRRALREHRPDAVWTNSPKALTMLAGTAPKASPPLVYYLRGWYRPETLSRLTRRLFLDRVSAFMAQSSIVADCMRRIGVEDERLNVVPNAVDIRELQTEADGPPQPPPPQLDRPIRLLLPATLIPAKGQCCAIRALGRLVRGGHEAVLYLAGHIADTRQQGYMDVMTEQARDSGVADRVCFLGWRTDLPRIVRSATMVVLPSHAEGMPRTVMEAMALERPVAATPVGGVPDLVIPQRTGWLFDVEDDAGLTEAITEALDAERRGRIVRQAFEHMRENFGVPRQVNGALSVFRRATGTAPAGPGDVELQEDAPGGKKGIRQGDE
jgi:glycosyltransferase involved in cell wall biosynthesis